MLHRKIEKTIEEHLKSSNDQILLIDGARQVGKTYIIRYIGKKLFKNFIEINLVEDSIGDRLFSDVTTISDFYFKLSTIAGNKMMSKKNTLIFIDEVQEYPFFLTLLKFLAQDGRFIYIASGSLLGITLSKTTSIPMGSIRKVQMFPLDFEEFLYANGFSVSAVKNLYEFFKTRQSLSPSIHDEIMRLFHRYLLIGGMPDAINAYLKTQNIHTVRSVQNEIHEYYAADASKYDKANQLKISRVYDLIPSNMENKKKRVIVQNIENKKGKSYKNYQDEFEYLISSGIAVNVQAISEPKFPLIQTEEKNLLKLYLNDVGILSGILYGDNIQPIINDVRSINLGSTYETVVATELLAHGFRLFYYDNRSKGEVDYLIDDYLNLSIIPIEVKSGRDYSIHSALNNLVNNQNYGVNEAFVLSNERTIFSENNITYMPIYFIMFFQNRLDEDSLMQIP